MSATIETRAAKREELDAMLALMCSAFSLPFNAARELFYKDPFFDIERKRVLLVDGRIVSCLTVVDAPLWIGQAAVRVGGIAGVATDEAHRRHGYAGRLLIGTLPALRAEGFGLTGLFPYSSAYYRRHGWERGGVQYRVTVPRHALPLFADARYVRPATSSDHKPIRELYARATQGKTGRWLRDPRRWDYLFTHAATRIVYKRTAVEGYALYETREEENGTARARVMEMLATTEEARRGLAGYFAQAERVGAVEYTGSWEDMAACGLLSPPSPEYDEGIHIEATGGAMYRVVDLGLCCKQLAPNFCGWQGELSFVLRDDQRPAGAPEAVTLYGDGKSVQMAAHDAGARSRHWLEGDVRAWAPVLIGYHGAQDAVALGRLHASSPEAERLAAPLLPRRDPFIPVPDYF